MQGCISCGIYNLITFSGVKSETVFGKRSGLLYPSLFVIALGQILGNGWIGWPAGFCPKGMKVKTKCFFSA